MGIDSLEDLRDVTIVAFTIAGTILFLLGIIVALLLVMILLYVRSAVSNLSQVVKGSLSPALENLRESSENIRNTSVFISEKTVAPVIKIYSIFAGGRRFARVLGGALRRRRK
ncbi:MAG TPA: hypothetical protein VNL15_07745 [Dehalococcoidia bacterium]|nr:hypothetical protein [Dehalococcoidia bacterium]